MEKHILLTLAIFIIGYVILGGMVFQRIEQPQQSTIERLQELVQSKPVALMNLTDIIAGRLSNLRDSLRQNSTSDCISSETDIQDLSFEISMEVSKFLIENIAPRNLRGDPVFNSTVDTGKLVITKIPALYDDWDFYGSLFFAATTITTIGYGHLVPGSEFGKMITVLYALVGIPLVAAFLGGLSDRIRKVAERLQERVPGKSKGSSYCFCCVAMMKILLVSLIGASIFIGLPAWLFMAKEENWSYIEALYFAFVTLSTIGFGDYIAARNPELGGLEWYRLFLVVWIFLGLAWLSSVIALIQAAITTYSAIAVESIKSNGSTKPDDQEFLDSDSLYDKRPELDNKRIKTRKLGKHYHGTENNPDRNKMSHDIDYDSTSFTSIDDIATRRNHSRGHVLSQGHRLPPNYRRNMSSSTQGLVSVAAAASTSQGDKYTIVGILPQMLQMAVSANATVESATDLRHQQLGRPTGRALPTPILLGGSRQNTLNRKKIHKSMVHANTPGDYSDDAYNHCDYVSSSGDELDDEVSPRGRPRSTSKGHRTKPANFHDILEYDGSPKNLNRTKKIVQNDYDDSLEGSGSIWIEHELTTIPFMDSNNPNANVSGEDQHHYVQPKKAIQSTNHKSKEKPLTRSQSKEKSSKNVHTPL